MDQVYIFGTNDSSQLARFYLSNDSPHKVVGHCVHREYLNQAEMDGLPVVSLEDLLFSCDRESTRFFVPLYATQMNKTRRKIYEEIKKAGFGFVSYVSSRSVVYTEDIGENTFIGENCTVQPYASIGDNTVIWAGNHIGHHSSIGDHCYLAGHVAVSGRVKIEDHCFVGGNCTIRDHVKIGEGTLVVMHSAIMGDTEPWSVWRGNPSRKILGVSSLDVEL